MLKPDLIARLGARHPHLERRVVEAVVASVLHEMSSVLRKGGRVELRGLVF